LRPRAGRHPRILARRRRERWYERDDAFDAEVRSRFLELWRKAAAGGLSSWETTEDGALALVIVLDQFPRNMFRNDIRAYSSDGLAARSRTAPLHAAPTWALSRGCWNFSTCP